MDEKPASQDNYYLFRAAIIGAKNTGKTTFSKNIITDVNEKDDHFTATNYRNYFNFAGKSKIKLELSDGSVPDA